MSAVRARLAAAWAALTGPRRYHRGDPDAPGWRAPARGGYSAAPEAEAFLPTPLPPNPPPGVLVRHVCDPTCRTPAQHERNVADDAHALTVRCPRCHALVTQPCTDPVGPCLARYAAADLAAWRARSAHPNRRPR